MPVRILVVDDDEMVRTNLEMVLTLEGYRVSSADSGFSVVELLAADGVDLIVLDISMPGMDGWETLKWLRESRSTAALPIVALSGDRLDIAEVRRAGFNAYLSKGGSLERFLCTIRSALILKVGDRGSWLHSCNGQRCLVSPLRQEDRGIAPPAADMSDAATVAEAPRAPGRFEPGESGTS